MKDWNKVGIGVGLVAGALAFYHYSQPAHLRVKVGDRASISLTPDGPFLRAKITEVGDDFVKAIVDGTAIPAPFPRGAVRELL